MRPALHDCSRWKRRLDGSVGGKRLVSVGKADNWLLHFLRPTMRRRPPDLCSLWQGWLDAQVLAVRSIGREALDRPTL